MDFMSNTKKCTVKGCEKAAGVLHVICGYHWARVPKACRAAVWSLKLEVPENRGWEKLMRAAIGVLEKAEKKGS